MEFQTKNEGRSLYCPKCGNEMDRIGNGSLEPSSVPGLHSFRQVNYLCFGCLWERKVYESSFSFFRKRVKTKTVHESLSAG